MSRKKKIITFLKMLARTFPKYMAGGDIKDVDSGRKHKPKGDRR